MKHETVLLVVGDSRTRETLARWLPIDGVHVRFVSHTHRLHCVAAESTRLRAALVDWSLNPALTHDAVKTLHTLWPGLPVILAASFGPHGTVEEAVPSTGPVYVVHQPLDLDDVGRLLAALVAGPDVEARHPDLEGAHDPPARAHDDRAAAEASPLERARAPSN